MIVILQGRFRRHLGRRIHIERLAHAIQHIGDLRAGDAIPHPQPGETIDLGESAGHDQVLILAQPLNTIRIVAFFHILHVGLIQHHNHPLGNP